MPCGIIASCGFLNLTGRLRTSAFLKEVVIQSSLVPENTERMTENNLASLALFGDACSCSTG